MEVDAMAGGEETLVDEDTDRISGDVSDEVSDNVSGEAPGEVKGRDVSELTGAIAGLTRY
jgi:hypothetical protein